MEHLTNVHEDCLSQHENSYKLCDEMGHPVLNLKESPWKMRQQHEQNSQWGGEAIVEQMLASEEKNLNEQDY